MVPFPSQHILTVYYPCLHFKVSRTTQFFEAKDLTFLTKSSPSSAGVSSEIVFFIIMVEGARDFSFPLEISF